MNQTGASDYTIYLEDGEQVYPCRCGEIHRGDYAIYDHGHHTCYHDTDLLELGRNQVVCPLCGKPWHVDDSMSLD